MINYGIVYSDTEPQSIEITDKAIFLAKNIYPYVEENEGYETSGYKFELTEYTKDEYIWLLGNQNEELKNNLLDTQAALCDIYEMLGGKDNG